MAKATKVATCDKCGCTPALRPGPLCVQCDDELNARYGAPTGVRLRDTALSFGADSRAPILLEAAERIAELEAALRKINDLIDSPSRFNADVQDVLDSVIDTSDTKFEANS